MSRKGIALFFLTVFLISAMAPTILSFIDGNSEICLLIDMGEEESKEKEASKDAETKIVHLSNTNLSLYGLGLSDAMGYYLKNYSKPYLNLVSPPPEQNV